MDKQGLIKFICKMRDKRRTTKDERAAAEEAAGENWKDLSIKRLAGKICEHFEIEVTGIKEHFVKEEANDASSDSA